MQILTVGEYYRLESTFDAYYCSAGRVAVKEGAIFLYESERTVYFVNSNNYLPFVAFDGFIECCKFSSIGLLNDYKKLHRGVTHSVIMTDIDTYTKQLADLVTAKVSYEKQKEIGHTDGVYGVEEFKCILNELLEQLPTHIQPEWEESVKRAWKGDTNLDQIYLAECNNHLLEALTKLARLTALVQINVKKFSNEEENYNGK